MGLNVNITDRNYRRLVLKVGLNSFSYIIFDTLNQRIIDVNEIKFSQNSTFISTEDAYKTVFEEIDILKENYDEVSVLLDNNLSSFVPVELFNEDYLGSYLQYNVKVFETDFFDFDELQEHQINNVYVPYININNFLLDKFETFEYKHSSTVLVSKILEISKNKEDKQVFVHFENDRFEIIVVQNQKLILYNSFDYSTQYDFIYYLLFTAEQLNLNPEFFNLTLMGQISNEDENYLIAYKYVRNTNLYTQLNPDFEPNTIRKHFILFNS